MAETRCILCLKSVTPPERSRTAENAETADKIREENQNKIIASDFENIVEQFNEEEDDNKTETNGDQVSDQISQVSQDQNVVEDDGATAEKFGEQGQNEIAASEKITEEIDKQNSCKRNDNRAQSVFLEFCKCFNITLSTGILSWDFDNEIAPICTDCQCTAIRLIKLHEELTNLQKMLQETEKSVRNQICESQKLLNNVPLEDRRILVVRDLIVGPVIRLESIEIPPIYLCSTVVKPEPGLDVHHSNNDNLKSNLGAEDQTLIVSQNGPSNSVIIAQDEFLCDLYNSPEDSGSDASTVVRERQGSKSKMRRNARRHKRSKKFVENSEDEWNETKPTYESDNNEDSDSDDSFSSGEDFKDDPRDKDFVLPGDEIENLRKDAKLSSKLLPNSKKKGGEGGGEETGTPEKHFIKKIDENRWTYGGYEFTKVDGFFKCSLCPDTNYAQIRRVRRHIRELHLGLFHRQCELCGRIFTRSPNYHSHMKKVHYKKIEQVMCEICGKEFHQKSYLRNHVATEHQRRYERPCEICGKIFKNLALLKDHIRSVHEKEKRFFCEQCGKGFFSKLGLRHHLTSHSGEKIFVCKYCGQKFGHTLLLPDI